MSRDRTTMQQLPTDPTSEQNGRRSAHRGQGSKTLDAAIELDAFPSIGYPASGLRRLQLPSKVGRSAAQRARRVEGHRAESHTDDQSGLPAARAGPRLIHRTKVHGGVLPSKPHIRVAIRVTALQLCDILETLNPAVANVQNVGLSDALPTSDVWVDVAVFLTVVRPFQPAVVVHADAGEQGHFFAREAFTRRLSAVGGESDLLGG